MNKSTWNNLLVSMSKMNLALHACLRNIVMVLSKPLLIDMPKSITFFYILAFLDVISIIISIPKSR